MLHTLWFGKTRPEFVSRVTQAVQQTVYIPVNPESFLQTDSWLEALASTEPTSYSKEDFCKSVTLFDKQIWSLCFQILLITFTLDAVTSV